MKKIFTRKIIEWHTEVNKRTMPWKGEKDPYKVWISEIILQQTRVPQGISYYNKFIRDFPTVKSLALAPDEAVFKVWEGLGYYSRCKNIILTAKKIVNDLNGNFPCTYSELLALKGIGPYTAAAISSFAYGLPHAVVDGNVFRVLARYFGEDIPIDTAKGREYFTRMANELLFKKDSGAYNQAIIDFGATVCKPKAADCACCILQKNCIAYKEGLVNALPVKEKQLLRKKRWFTYFVFLIEDMVLVNKRVQKDIWENLYEFYLFETDKEWEWNAEVITKWLKDQLSLERFKLKEISRLFIQQLTHQHLQGRFVTIRLDNLPVALLHLKPVNKEELAKIPFPKMINEYLINRKIQTD